MCFLELLSSSKVFFFHLVILVPFLGYSNRCIPGFSQVLTAAHCISESDRGDYTRVVNVDLGVHHQFNILKNPKFERFGIKRVIKYPGFPEDLTNPDLGHLKDDIALIQLDRPAALNDRVGTICLPKKGVYPKVGTKCILAGKYIKVLWSGKTRHLMSL